MRRTSSSSIMPATVDGTTDIDAGRPRPRVAAAPPLTGVPRGAPCRPVRPPGPARRPRRPWPGALRTGTVWPTRSGARRAGAGPADREVVR